MNLMNKLTTYATLIGVIGAIGGGVNGGVITTVAIRVGEFDVHVDAQYHFHDTSVTCRVLSPQLTIEGSVRQVGVGDDRFLRGIGFGRIRAIIGVEPEFDHRPIVGIGHGEIEGEFHTGSRSRSTARLGFNHTGGVLIVHGQGDWAVGIRVVFTSTIVAETTGERR